MKAQQLVNGVRGEDPQQKPALDVGITDFLKTVLGLDVMVQDTTTKIRTMVGGIYVGCIRFILIDLQK